MAQDRSLKKNSHAAGTAAVLGAGICWGTSCLYVRGMSALGMTSVMQTAFKMFLTFLFYFILLMCTDRSKLRFNIRDIWIFAASGMFSMSVFTWLHYYVLIHGQASVTTALIYTSPIFVMLMSAVIFKEKITKAKIAALLLSVLGCALTAGAFSESYRTPLMIVVLSLLAGVAYATYSLLAKHATRKYQPLTMTMYTFLFASICTIPFGHVPEALRLMAHEPRLIALCLGKNAFASALPFFLYTWGISRIEAGRAAVFATMEPLVSCALGIIVLGEPSNISKILGIALILGAVVLLNTRKAYHETEKC